MYEMLSTSFIVSFSSNFSDNGKGVDKANHDLASPDHGKVRDRGIWRDLTAYWIFGLCNNFGYVVMLTAAHDIIKELAGDEVSRGKVNAAAI